MPGTRERIVEATAATLMRRGYAASGLKQISTESDAPPGSMYHFFPGGKQELAAETLRWSGRGYQVLVERVFDAAPDLVSGVRNCFEGAAAVLEASDFADACPIATVALEVASVNEPLRLVTAEIFDQWMRSVIERLEAGGVKKKRAKELAPVLVAALEGGFLLSRAAKDATAMRTIGQAMVELVKASLP
jgi:AcrR family transcriptional regulator